MGVDDSHQHPSTQPDGAGPATFRVEAGAGVVIHVAGELDALGGPQLTALLDDAFSARPDRVVVDMTGLAFIGSVGLSTLVTAHNRGAAEGIASEVHNIPASCLQVFEITQLVDILDLR